jgi:hypothetical protein
MSRAPRAGEGLRDKVGGRWRGENIPCAHSTNQVRIAAPAEHSARVANGPLAHCGTARTFRARGQ